MIWICPSETGHPQSRIPRVHSSNANVELRYIPRKFDMEMWKMLTQKFKAQSLDEVQPFQPTEVEDRDSGTESDEENAELQAIEEAMQSKRDQENQPMLLSSSGTGHFALNMTPTSPVFQSPTMSASSPVSSVSKRPFQLVNQPSIPFQPLDNTGFSQHYNTLESPRESPLENSDYERCSLDYEPTSSVEFERHSSEEELTIINCMNRELHSEKRKWSQVNRCNSCNNSSGSSDEEVRDLLGQPKPLNFSSSPPKGVQRLSQTLSPKLFLANLSPNNVRLCSVSPRKRHRQMSDVADAVTVIQRPCLDFEKMQKTLFRKHIPHGIAKARIVKIRLGLLKGAM